MSKIENLNGTFYLFSTLLKTKNSNLVAKIILADFFFTASFFYFDMETMQISVIMPFRDYVPSICNARETAVLLHPF